MGQVSMKINLRYGLKISLYLLIEDVLAGLTQHTLILPQTFYNSTWWHLFEFIKWHKINQIFIQNEINNPLPALLTSIFLISWGQFSSLSAWSENVNNVLHVVSVSAELGCLLCLPSLSPAEFSGLCLWKDLSPRPRLSPPISLCWQSQESIWATGCTLPCTVQLIRKYRLPQQTSAVLFNVT